MGAWRSRSLVSATSSVGTRTFVGDEQAYLLGFPWYDNVDAMLLAREARQLPLDLDEGSWDDIEQGWWASVIPVGP